MGLLLLLFVYNNCIEGVWGSHETYYTSLVLVFFFFPYLFFLFSMQAAIPKPDTGNGINWETGLDYSKGGWMGRWFCLPRP